MTDDHIAAFTAAFERWYGDPEAVRLCLDLLHVAHAWDDMIDGDPCPRERIDGAFRRALYDIPANPFYQRHAGQLLPLLANVMLQWHAANAYEADKTDLPKAYMLRAGIYSIFAQVALLAGGPEWARQVAPEVWRLYGETVDTFMGGDDA